MDEVSVLVSPLLLFYGDFLIYEATQFHYVTSRSYTSCSEHAALVQSGTVWDIWTPV